MKQSGLRPTEPPLAAVTFDGSGLALVVDLGVFSKEATLRACYKFTDRAYVFLARGDGTELIVTLRAKSREQSLSPLAGDFANELVDQQLRQDLEIESGQVRNLIVAQAFAEGNLLDEDRDEGDYRGDPADIGRHR
jgi:His-Xaa-Ser system protein HxsD